MDEDRTWSRLQRNLVIGAGVGATIGIVLGLILGAIVFSRQGAIAASALAGAIGIGGVPSGVCSLGSSRPTPATSPVRSTNRSATCPSSPVRSARGMCPIRSAAAATAERQRLGAAESTAGMSECSSSQC
jgi:hypothetical protein